MKTWIWPVSEEKALPPQAGQFLREGQLVAFPTETVYGLGANALDGTAVKKIFAAKGRPQDNPLISHIYSLGQLEQYGKNLSSTALKLAHNFWPGPLTIIVEDNGLIASEVRAGLNSVSFRMPDHPVALALLKAAQLPIAAPSANLSGHPSPTTAQHVQDDLGGKIAAIVDGGACRIGLESTVVDAREETPIILRPGAITPEQIKALIGQVQIDPALLNSAKQADFKPLAPGLKYRHYSPQAPLFLGEVKSLTAQAQEAVKQGKKVGVWGRAKNQATYPASVVFFSMGSDPEMAADLYAVLREMDRQKVDLILVEGEKLNWAVANRLHKAATKIIF